MYFVDANYKTVDRNLNAGYGRELSTPTESEDSVSCEHVIHVT